MSREPSLQELKSAYKRTIRALNDVADECEDPEIVAEADAALAVARRAYKRAVRNKFTDRTKLLRILVHRLDEVTDEIRTSSETEHGLDRFKAVLDGLAKATTAVKKADEASTDSDD